MSPCRSLTCRAGACAAPGALPQGSGTASALQYRPRCQPLPPMSDALTALSPLDGRYAGKVDALRPIFSEYGLIRARVKVEVEWLLALAAEPGHRRAAAVLRGRRRPPARAGRRLLASSDAARVKAIEAHHQPRRQGGRILHQGAAEGRRRAGPGAGVRALRLHQRGHQQPVLRADAEPGAAGRAAAEARRADRRSCARWRTNTPRCRCSRAPTARPPRRPPSARNWPTSSRACSASGEVLAGLPMPGKINGAVGNYNAHVAAYPDVDWPAFSRRFVESLDLDWQPYTTQIEPHDGVAELCDAAKRIDTIAIDLCRDIWGYISLGYFKQAVKAGEVGSIDHAAQGQPDRLRERRRQLRHRQRAVRAFRDQAADQPLAARPHRLHRAARAGHRLRPHADRLRRAAARPGQAQRQPGAPGRRPRRQPGKCWPRPCRR